VVVLPVEDRVDAEQLWPARVRQLKQFKSIRILCYSI
jgi:hypothetical protein